MTEYSDQERQTLRTAAFGAVYLVSRAEPGMLDLLKESFAGSKAFATASPQLRDLLKSGGVPKLPPGSPTDVESGIIAALENSAALLEAKGQPELDGFRSVVTTAVDSVANAAGGGTSDTERAAISKVKAALGAP